MRLSNGKVIGGYTTVPWERSGDSSYSSAPGSFLFSITDDWKHSLIRENTAVLREPNYGPTFGGGHDLTIGPAAIAETPIQSPVRAVQAVGEPVNEDCHWGDIDRVHSTMTTLTINEQMMDVRGLENRAWIATELQRCGYPDAAEAFNEWRESRRATNIACGTGVGCYAIPVGIWASVQAKKHRLAMERALLSPRADADEE